MLAPGIILLFRTLLFGNLTLSLDRPSYIPPVKIGEVMRGATLGRVIASKSSKIKEQELVTTWSGWTTFAVLKDSEVEQASALGAASKPTDYLSILGPTSLTAYFGMLRIGEPRAGETVVVSGAAGATGNIAGQIAGLQGARVIGIAGSDEKCRWLVEELGFALALNYKHPEFEKQFQEAASDGIDVYFDNVGGRILDLALSQANERARFVMCGGVSQYNGSDTYALKVSNISFLI